MQIDPELAKQVKRLNKMLINSRNNLPLWRPVRVGGEILIIRW